MTKSLLAALLVLAAICVTPEARASVGYDVATDIACIAPDFIGPETPCGVIPSCEVVALIVTPGSNHLAVSPAEKERSQRHCLGRSLLICPPNGSGGAFHDPLRRDRRPLNDASVRTSVGYPPPWSTTAVRRREADPAPAGAN